MWSDQAYYFSDSSFQLELNLQSVRRSLIQTLDDFEAADCSRCCHIKCRCEQTETTLPGSVEPTPGHSLTGGIPAVSLTGPTPGQSLGGGIPAVSLTGPTPGQSLAGGIPAVSLTGPTPGQSLGGGIPVVSLTGPAPGQSSAGGIPAVSLTGPAPGQSLGGGIPPVSLTGPTPGQSLAGGIPAVSLVGLTPGQSLTGATLSQSESGPTPGQSWTGVSPPLTGSGQDTDALKSPPAIDLPRPDFKTSSETNDPPAKDVESWVRASTPNPDKTDSPGSKPYAYLANFSWPPTPKSVWNDYKNKINRPEINTATVSQAGNVQDFFKSFNVNMYCIGAKHAHAQNRALMQKLKFMAVKQPEYSYF